MGILAASNDDVAIDQYLHVKMGYKPFESPITKPFARTDQINVIGDDLHPIPNWRKVSWRTRASYKILFKFMGFTKQKLPFAVPRMEETLKKQVLMDVIPSKN